MFEFFAVARRTVAKTSYAIRNIKSKVSSPRVLVEMCLRISRVGVLNNSGDVVHALIRCVSAAHMSAWWRRLWNVVSVNRWIVSLQVCRKCVNLGKHRIINITINASSFTGQNCWICSQIVNWWLINRSFFYMNIAWVFLSRELLILKQFCCACVKLLLVSTVRYVFGIRTLSRNLLGYVSFVLFHCTW